MAEHTRIVSSTPRRTRIRVSRKRRNPKEMARLAKALEAFPQVSSVQTNLHTGTLIVHHKEEALEDIRSKLKDLGVILMAATGVEMPAKWLTDAVSDLDRRLSSQTEGPSESKAAGAARIRCACLSATCQTRLSVRGCALVHTCILRF